MGILTRGSFGSSSDGCGIRIVSTPCLECMDACLISASAPETHRHTWAVVDQICVTLSRQHTLYVTRFSCSCPASSFPPGSIS